MRVGHSVGLAFYGLDTLTLSLWVWQCVMDFIIGWTLAGFGIVWVGHGVCLIDRHYV